MPFNKTYSEAEAVIATYNYTDIAEGTGSVNFYLARTAKSGPAYSYHLTSDTTYNSFGIRVGGMDGNIVFFINNATTTFTFNLSPFNLPKIVKGTALINLFYLIGVVNGSTLYVTATIYHVDAGGTPTLLGSGISHTATGAASATTGVGVFSLPITLALTHFKKGEYLRLVVAGTANNTAGSPVRYIGTDPANSTFTSTGVGPRTMFKTSSFVKIPFRIDL